ncbi:diacylglycerol/lipid kinase family protein [Lapidilactobacillus mulanensis]|uniref:Diacylglycerol/lipid kinase family protein n=1 Tax=Lapidilactobacillus mulanensis TaxID=2485999 RepID=A0ABW4DKR6_9LACO|nr:diacylglycerol kinase family protein [Lapidilactobacillus mulanensis]
MPNFIVIVNLKAGSGEAAEVWPQLQQELKQAQIHYTAHISEYAGHAIALAEKISTEATAPTVLIVVGGDGTVNQVLNGVRRSENPNTPIAYFPAGSGNDFARSLNLTKNAGEFVKQLKETTQATPLNIFDVNITDSENPIYRQQKFLINNFGIGFDAHVVHLTENSTTKTNLNRWHIGNLAYIANILTVFKRQQPFKLTVFGEKTEYFEHAYLTTMTNIAYFGGGVKIVPTADPREREIDLIVIEKPSTPRFLKLFGQILTNGHHLQSPYVHLFKADQIRYEIEPAQYGQMDGEDMGKHRFQISAVNAQHPFWI